MRSQTQVQAFLTMGTEAPLISHLLTRCLIILLICQSYLTFLIVCNVISRSLTGNAITHFYGKNSHAFHLPTLNLPSCYHPWINWPKYASDVRQWLSHWVLWSTITWYLSG